VSSNETKVLNDIEELYSKPIEHNGEFFICPVCGKKAKKNNTIEAHMNEKDCHSISDMLMNTVYEQKAFSLFKEINNGQSLFFFRKNILYSRYLKFSLWCSLKQIDQSLFYGFLEDYYKNKPESYILKYGASDTIVGKFRVHLLRHPNMIDSAKFISTYKDELLKDPLFLTRSIESAKVSIEACVDDPEISDAMSNLPIDYYERLDALFVEVQTWK
jgi:hypothetical protein